MNKKNKYEEIRDIIINEIKEKKYKSGDKLPSEIELMERFHVSRITIRRALDELYQGGYIDKHQGKRAYVKNAAHLQELSSILSYTEEIIKQGMIPSRKVLDFGLRLANEREQESLQIDKTAPIFFLKRIIYADNRALCYTSTYLPYKYFKDIEFYDFSENSLYDILENKYNVQLSSAILKIKAVAAPANIAKQLDIEDKNPLLHTSSIKYGNIEGNTLAVELFDTYYVTDYFEYTLRQKR